MAQKGFQSPNGLHLGHSGDTKRGSKHWSGGEKGSHYRVGLSVLVNVVKHQPNGAGDQGNEKGGWDRKTVPGKALVVGGQS